MGNICAGDGRKDVDGLEKEEEQLLAVMKPGSRPSPAVPEGGSSDPRSDNKTVTFADDMSDADRQRRKLAQQNSRRFRVI